jgi:hypothetical protein
VRSAGDRALPPADPLGASPFNVGRTLRPSLRVTAVDRRPRGGALLDERYNAHWNERLGHIVFFEAMPGTREATRQLLDAACAWLEQKGAVAARAGFGMLEMMFTTDAYEALPPSFLRQNPAYYHALLKDARFETEKGAVDYKIAFIELVQLAGCSRGGAARRLDRAARRRAAGAPRAQFNDTCRKRSRATGGSRPPGGGYVEIFAAPELTGMLDTSVLAYGDGKPVVGCLWVAPETTFLAATAPGRQICARRSSNSRHRRARPARVAVSTWRWRRRFLELVRRGAKHLSNTFVLDDNWPSRRTAEKLGATVRELRHRRNSRRPRLAPVRLESA